MFWLSFFQGSQHASLLLVGVEEAADRESKHEGHTSIGRLSKPMEEDIFRTGGRRKTW
jgi:hypothetical protein